MSDKIKSYFGNGLRWGVDITYSEEEKPLGTAGAIKKAQKYLNDTFIVLNGDSYSQIDLKDLLRFHKEINSLATISLTKTKDSSHYGNVITNKGKIVEFIEKDSRYGGLINSGIYVFEPKILDYIPSEISMSLEKEIFPGLAREMVLNGYIYEGYFMDMGRPETYERFKKDVLNTLLLKEHHTIKDALAKIHKSEINIVLIVDGEMKLLGVLTDRIIKKFLIDGGNIKDSVTMAMSRNPKVARTTEPKNKIYELLDKGINSLPILDEFGRVKSVEFRHEKIKSRVFKILRGRAPLRISLAGGGTDLPYFFDKYGGCVISSTINKYCYATIAKRADSKIIIDSDLNEEKFFNSIRELNYNGEYDLIKAIIKVMEPDFGFDLYLHNDIPPGRGLGSSASLAVLVARLISNLQETNYNDQKIAEFAYRAEREELGIKGGWQDQYASVIGGFNFMEFSKEKKLVYPLKLKEDIINELSLRILLCYVGRDHVSSDVHEDQEKTFTENEEEVVKNLNEIKQKALQVRDCLLLGELDDIGNLLHESWLNKKKLSGKISNTNIDKFYETGIKNGATGGKVLGAGNGGYILFFHPPTKRNQLIKALKFNGGEIMDFNFDFNGTQIWDTRSQ